MDMPLTPDAKNALRRAMVQARNTLIFRGWSELHTMLNDDPIEGHFGTCFEKGDRAFWLNLRTVEQLPEPEATIQILSDLLGQAVQYIQTEIAVRGQVLNETQWKRAVAEAAAISHVEIAHHLGSDTTVGFDLGRARQVLRTINGQ